MPTSGDDDGSPDDDSVEPIVYQQDLTTLTVKYVSPTFIDLRS